MSKFDYVKVSTRCEFAKRQQELDPQDIAELKDALQNPSIPIAHIMRVLEQMGFKVAETTLRTHRRGGCQTCSMS